MKLRTKTHLSIAAVLLSLAVFAYLSASMIILKKFNAIETDRMSANVGRFVDALNAEFDGLDQHNQDWAWWNDTYKFVADGNKDFIQDNLNGQSLSILKINYIFLLNGSDKIVFETGVSLSKEEMMQVPEGIESSIAANDPLLAIPDFHSGLRNIISTPDGLLMATSRKILTSDRKGPAHGTLIMGRLIDAAKIAEWEKLTHLPVEVYRINDQSLPADVKAAALQMSSADATYIKFLDSNTIAGYALISDLSNKPVMIFKVALPRSIYKQAKSSMTFFMVTLMTIGIVFWLIAVLLLESTVLKRLLKLDSNVASIATKGDAGSRVDLSGNDEISALSVSINDMLAALDASRAQLAINEARYRTIFENTGTATAIAGPDGMLRLVNAEFLRLCGFSREVIEGKKKWQDFITPTDENAPCCSNLKIPGICECKFVDMKNFVHDVQIVTAAIPGTDNFVVSIADLTEHKFIEAALLESEEKYRTLVERSHDAVFVIESDKFVFANHQMCEITGFGMSDIIGMSVWRTLLTDDHDRFREYLDKRIHDETTADTHDFRIVTKDRSFRFVELSLQKITFKGKPVMLGTFRDVTERREAEEALRNANRELEIANQTKTEFTSMVSHDIRTPLGTIKQAIEIVMEGIDGEINDKQRERLSVAQRNVDRLVRLTNNILDFTKLETGRMELNFEMTNMNELIADIYTFMKPAIDAKRIKLTSDLPNEQLKIGCDADKLRQVLINLMDNAIKFTGEEGRISLKLARVEDGARIDVEDNGIGMKNENLAMLFEPFKQFHKIKMRGSGLGLSICKQIIEMHGGRIEVQSDEGKGTTFSIFLPPAKDSQA